MNHKIIPASDLKQNDRVVVGNPLNKKISHFIVDEVSHGESTFVKFTNGKTDTLKSAQRVTVVTQ